MDKIAMYKEQIYKEAGIKGKIRGIKKAIQRHNELADGVRVVDFIKNKGFAADDTPKFDALRKRLDTARKTHHANIKNRIDVSRSKLINPNNYKGDWDVLGKHNDKIYNDTDKRWLLIDKQRQNASDMNQNIDEARKKIRDKNFKIYSDINKAKAKAADIAPAAIIGTGALGTAIGVNKAIKNRKEKQNG